MGSVLGNWGRGASHSVGFTAKTKNQKIKKRSQGSGVTALLVMPGKYGDCDGLILAAEQADGVPLHCGYAPLLRQYRYYLKRLAVLEAVPLMPHPCTYLPKMPATACLTH